MNHLTINDLHLYAYVLDLIRSFTVF